MDTSSNHRHGRPSKAEEIDIENKIWPCFVQSFSTETASQITGYNIKTVQRYYKKFYSRINTDKEKDYVKEWQMIKKKAGFALELQLAEKLELQNSLTKQSKIYENNREQVPSWIYKERRRISESIQDTILSITNLALSPTADLTLKNQTRGLLQEHGLAE